MRRISPFLLLLALALSGCSTMVNRATQEITIETPGTEGAICFIERPGYRSRVWTPKTIRINKSRYPLQVNCIAQGNREKTVVVEPVLPDSFYLNVFNGLAMGALIDYETGSMFTLPDKIVVDFTDMKPKPMPLPSYQRVIDDNPDIARTEAFKPGKSMLERDRNRVIPDLQPRRVGDEVDLVQAPSGEAVVTVAPAEASVPASTADDLTRSMNPQVFGVESKGEGKGSASGSPVELAPSPEDK